jgi:hypothetical protein
MRSVIIHMIIEIIDLGYAISARAFGPEKKPATVS